MGAVNPETKWVYSEQQGSKVKHMGMNLTSPQLDGFVTRVYLGCGVDTHNYVSGNFSMDLGFDRSTQTPKPAVIKSISQIVRPPAAG
jgi:hypothetical protein